MVSTIFSPVGNRERLKNICLSLLEAASAPTLKILLSVTFLCQSLLLLSQGSQPDQTAIISFVLKKAPQQVLVSVSDARVVDGKLKEIQTGPVHWNSHDLVCLVSDVNMIPLDTFVIEHPLKKNFEFVNEDGQLVWKTLSVDEDYVMIRFLFQSQMQWITVYSAAENRELILLDTFPMPEGGTK